MIVRRERERPEAWSARRKSVRARWVVPFAALEWVWEWAAWGLSNWTFIEVLEYLETFSVLVVVIFYFAESGDRVKQRHYQAWQVINTAQGKGGSGGRIEALQELNADKVPLVGVDVSTAFLEGVNLRRANLVRADLSSADLRDADLNGASLAGADLSGAALDDADLRGADLAGVAWSHLKSVKGANIAGVRNAPAGFVDWARKSGAVEQAGAE